MAKNKIEIPKLILDHLLQYGDTSILGLGTLYFSYQSAYLSDDKSKLFPPSNTLHFSDTIEETDGFVAYVANRLNIDVSKALKEIDEYAQDIINNLLNYGQADIPNVGQFTKGDEEDIEFTQCHGEVNSDFFGLMPVKLKPIQFFKGGEMAGAPKAVSTASMPIRTSAASEIASTTKATPSYKYDDDDDSNWLRPMLWILGLVLLCAILYKGCESYKSNQSKLIAVTPVDTTVVNNGQSGSGIDTINAKDIKIDKPVKKDKPTECVIILGAFGSATNAMKMSTKVSQLGYTPYEEYFDTMDLTRVGFKFDCSEKDLEEFMHEIRKDITEDAWYLVPRITVD